MLDGMEAFFRSLAEAFARNRSAFPQAGALLLVLAVLAAAPVLAAAVRRRRAARARLRDLAERHGLSPGDLGLAARMAREVGASPLALLTRLGLFERATARTLAGAAAERATAPAIRRLRTSLGFDRLGPHDPLLTSRELSPGAPVTVQGRLAEVSEVEERSFTVELRGAARLRPGDSASLELEHAGEARYRLRCRVLGVRREGLGQAIRLEHDEAPERVQRRAFARVRADGALVLRPVALVSPDGAAPELRCDLLDASGGGARVASPGPLPAGTLATASFALAGWTFTDLRTVVLSSSRAADDRHVAHLAWTRIPEAERDRLAAAVAHLQPALAAEERSGRAR